MKKRFVTLLLVWAIVIPAAASGLILLLWNALMPALFGLATIGFWQAVGLFLLCQVLSGGFAFGLFLLAGGIHSICYHHNRAAHERWKNMTDAERREAFLQRMARFGQWRRPDGKNGKEAEENGNGNGQ